MDRCQEVARGHAQLLVGCAALLKSGHAGVRHVLGWGETRHVPVALSTKPDMHFPCLAIGLHDHGCYCWRMVRVGWWAVVQDLLGTWHIKATSTESSIHSTANEGKASGGGVARRPTLHLHRLEKHIRAIMPEA